MPLRQFEPYRSDLLTALLSGRGFPYDDGRHPFAPYEMKWREKVIYCDQCGAHVTSGIVWFFVYETTMIDSFCMECVAGALSLMFGGDGRG